MGHAFQCTLMDVLIRYHRMQGRDALWQAGTDHAGIATQMVVERLLQAQGRPRTEMGRERFVEQIWEWKERSGNTISNQLRRLGTSLDWTTERFTMDDELSQAVQEVFVALYRQGLIYRGKRLVNWDPVLQTAISDLEVIATEEDGYLWHFRYPIHGKTDAVVIATTRPETLLGDTAVAVHPDDARYRHLIGQTVDLPLVNRQIPIVADAYVDPEFGTGCVKITPGHDFNDYAVGQRQHLEVINIMTPQAEINLPDSTYHGLSRFDARAKVVEDMQRLKLVEKIENHRHKVPRGDRTGQIIEPYLTDQWFVQVEPLARAAIEAVRSGQIRFVPKNWESTYFDWMENIEDWCISRQIWWGHRIPAWYDAQGSVFVASEETDAQRQARELHNGAEVALTRDEDVLDTWFSSALWPFSTLGWPQQTERLGRYYPTNVLVTGFDIIFFWVARMIMFGLRFTDEIPFYEVYIHGLVRDSEGQKMSKSKGNILDPLDLIDGIELDALLAKRTTGLMQPELAPKIEEATRRQFPDGIPAYGTDALRFTFARLATQGRDIRFNLGQIGGYRNFCNKIWNASRFVLMNSAQVKPYSVDDFSPVTIYEEWIFAKLLNAVEGIDNALRLYRFDLASKVVYEFIWNEYCAWFIEFAKVKLLSQATHPAAAESLRRTLLMVMDASLRLLHPFMPFVTEEIWQKIRTDERSESIMLETYSDSYTQSADSQAVADVEWLRELISAIRNLRSEMSVNAGDRISAYYEDTENRYSRILQSNADIVISLARLKSLADASEHERHSGMLDASQFSIQMIGDFRLFLPLENIEVLHERASRIARQIEKLRKAIEASRNKLGNQQFVTNAPRKIVEKERNRLAEDQKAVASLQQKLQNIEQLRNSSH